ncbi:inorganic phosphate transporter [Hydrogenophaga aromaticivorans]|uniref:Phosphate transporter n=1 Tax=Hydrogenophaga aromaticivorans TaxID=2610898 RepID=A0A7Y8KZI0_9BURK|nr:inorganic phosphate transporter [Hydrogenophaga aromaticivorans]MBQ0918418.1 inorganic phosphate transporter [Hydrogenophaga aromaticivorans]NWF48029.1 inorganic phosphate transporter [Hydrogenophaga aromaticivorans]
MTKKSRSSFVTRHMDALQLASAIGFLLLVGLYASLTGANVLGLSSTAVWLLIISAVVGGYMAMNIGANDVANNMGPAVGSGAMTMGWAIVVAAVFEAMGAIVAGGEVVGTIKGGIIDSKQITDATLFAWVMFAALLAGALWLHLATAIGAPVSTTHSIIGAVMGAGIAAGGWGLVNWGTIGSIVMSWVISPLSGGAVAAAFLYLIKRSITYRNEMTEAASRVVPWLIALMAWAFCTYMLLKGLGQLVKVDFWVAVISGAGFGGVAWALVRKPIARTAMRQDNSKEGVNRLFIWPLVCSAALLSFAHGANDVANAVGPLAAIYEAVKAGEIATKAATPLWVMVLGALGLAAGLALYGARLIRTVGKEITELDNMRAYSIAMSATLTVIVASQMGMPVSTTHISIGAVFGVGFLRELLKVNYAKMEAVVFAGHQGEDRAEVEAYLQRFEAAEVQEKKRMLADMKRRARLHEAAEGAVFAKKEQKALKKAYKKELVKRSAVLRIVAAWIVTVPATAVLAAILFHLVAAVLG